MIRFKQIDELTIGECFESLVGNQSNANAAQSVEIVSKFRELWGNMSFEDQFRFLEHYKSYKENDVYIEIKELFCLRTEEIRKKEQADYEFCEQIEDYSDFINTYSSMLPAYQPLFLEKAKQRKGQLEETLEREKREREKREKEEHHKRIKLSLLITLAFIIVAGLIVFFIGYQPVGDFSLSEKNFVFEKEGGVKVAIIKTKADYVKVLFSEDSWIVRKEFDKDNKTITIEVDQNEGKEQNTTLTVIAYPSFFGNPWRDYGKKLTVIITQKSGYASLLEVEENISFSQYGERKNIPVKTNGVLLSIKPAKDCERWLHCSIKEDNHDGIYYHDAICEIVAEENPNDKRIGKIIVESGGLSKEVIVNQLSGYANMIVTSQDSFSVSKWGEIGSFNIKSDAVSYQVTANKSWIHIYEIERNNNKDYHHDINYRVVFDKNNELVNRDGQIAITSGEKTEAIMITQASGRATTLTVNPKTVTCKKGDGYESFNVSFSTDGTSWTITKPDWIHVKEQITQGKGFIEITPKYNYSGEQTGRVVIASNNGNEQVIVVKQPGEPYDFKLSSSAWIPGVSGGSKSVTASNDGGYYISINTNRDWLSAKKNGKTITITCERNESEPRAGKVTVKCRNTTRTIVVKQDGYKDCDDCHGDGKCHVGKFVPDIWGGHYVHSWPDYDLYLQCPVTRYCRHCGGDGKCPKCKGRGKKVVAY
jgi:hypothetical protein